MISDLKRGNPDISRYITEDFTFRLAQYPTLCRCPIILPANYVVIHVTRYGNVSYVSANGELFDHDHPLEEGTVIHILNTEDLRTICDIPVFNESIDVMVEEWKFRCSHSYDIAILIGVNGANINDIIVNYRHQSGSDDTSWLSEAVDIYIWNYMNNRNTNE